MKILFIVDELSSLKLKTDSSIAIMNSFIDHGHTVFFSYQNELFLHKCLVYVSCRKVVSISNTEKSLKEAIVIEDIGKKPAKHFDCILMRKDPPVDMDYITAIHLLKRAQQDGCCVLNSATGILNYPEKLSIFNFSDLIPRSLVTSSMLLIKEFCQDVGDSVIKPLNQSGGESVFFLRKNDLNFNVILEISTQNGTKCVMVQQYLPDIRNGDKRILIMNGVPVPYSLVRTSQPNELRANLSAGGEGYASALSKHDEEIALRIGSELIKDGIFLIGLDKIGDYITEINITSPTCFVEITQQTGLDVSKMFVKSIETYLSSLA